MHPEPIGVVITDGSSDDKGRGLVGGTAEDVIRQSRAVASVLRAVQSLLSNQLPPAPQDPLGTNMLQEVVAYLVFPGFLMVLSWKLWGRYATPSDPACALPLPQGTTGLPFIGETLSFVLETTVSEAHSREMKSAAFDLSSSGAFHTNVIYCIASTTTETAPPSRGCFVNVWSVGDRVQCAAGPGRCPPPGAGPVRGSSPAPAALFQAVLAIWTTHRELFYGNFQLRVDIVDTFLLLCDFAAVGSLSMPQRTLFPGQIPECAPARVQGRPDRDSTGPRETLKIGMAPLVRHPGCGAEFSRKRHALYGDVFKTHILGRPTIRVRGADNVRKILRGENDIVGTMWPDNFRMVLGTQNLAMCGSGPVHRQRKKTVMRAFRHDALAIYTDSIKSLVTLLSARVKI
ncbi:hypothetical protein Bbelb_441180 [Branchiostoma belcheri]|nr:hypothetical protein Bbelb_441180 [Branchiostoma belcheri]